MNQDNVIPISNPQESTTDALTAVLRQGAQQLLTKALEAEIEILLSQYTQFKEQGSLSQVVRNGYLPERSIQTGIGTIQIKVPRIRDRGGSGIKFTSAQARLVKEAVHIFLGRWCLSKSPHGRQAMSSRHYRR